MVFKKNHNPWNKGLTEETDERVKEYGYAGNQTFKNNPEIVRNRVIKRKQTLKDNPSIIKNAVKKFKQTLKNNSNIKKNAIIRRKQTYDNNLEIQKIATIKFKQTLENNPNIKIKASKKFKQTLKDNPEIMRNKAKKLKQTLKNHPEIIIQKSKYLHNNPQILQKVSDSVKRTLKNNPEIICNRAKKCSARCQGIELKDWTHFIGRKSYDQRWDNIFRRRIRKRDNQICMMCKIHREKLKKALSVHHINYNKEMTIPQNCISLCASCHSKTWINREHWTNIFQSILSEQYDYKYDNDNKIILNVIGCEKVI